MGKILKFSGPLVAVEGGRPNPHRVAGEVYEATQQARAILSRAEVEAQRIRSKADADAKAIRSQAEAEREQLGAEAAEAGREEGLAQATREVAFAAFERERLLVSTEQEVVRLSLAIAQEILRREVARETPVKEIAARALAEVRQCRVVRLRVHPADAAALRAAESSLTATLARVPSLTLREDSTIAPGGVMVETEGGVIDARLDTQLEALRRAFEEMMPR